MQQFPYSMLHSPIILRYALMVGTPLCVLWTMLEMGKGIVAPVAVGGEWRLERVASPPTDSCPTDPFTGSLTVAQAGQYLMASKSALSLTGHISGDSLTLQGGTAVLTAHLANHTAPLTLEGTWSAGASGCNAIPFRATLYAPVSRSMASAARH